MRELLREMVSPSVVGWHDLILASGMVALAVWALALGDLAFGIVMITFGLSILAAEVRAQAMYRKGYAQGMFDQMCRGAGLR